MRNSAPLLLLGVVVQLIFVASIFKKSGGIGVCYFVNDTSCVTNFSESMLKPKMESMAICWFVDDNYLDRALVSAYSVSRVLHTEIFKYVLRIFLYNHTEPISELNQKRAKAINMMNPILPLEIEPFDMRFRDRIPQQNFGNYSWVVLPRLFATNFIKEDWILYLDCDVLCGRDFANELVQVMDWNHPLFGVLDIGTTIPFMQKYIISKGFNLSHYINSGVLLMKNGQELEYYLNRTIDYINTHHDSRFPDQDGLNGGFGIDKIGLLPHDFNCHFCVRRKISQTIFLHGKTIGRFYGRMWGELYGKIRRFNL